MTVYIDLLFALNTAVNYLLLRGSAAMGGAPAPPLRLLGAACIGGLYAALAVLPSLLWLGTPFYQLLCAALMLFCAFGAKRSTVKQGLLFLALSFAFGGTVLLAVQFLDKDLLLLGGMAYYAVSTPALLLCAGLCYGLAAVVLAGFGTHTGGDLFPANIHLGPRQITVTVLRDTGNTLRDPITGRPVTVANWQCLAKLLPDVSLTQQQFLQPAQLMQRLADSCPQHRFQLIPYRAVGTDCGLLLAVRCQVQQMPTLVAFSPTEVSPEGRFEALTGGIIP